MVSPFKTNLFGQARDDVGDWAGGLQAAAKDLAGLRTAHDALRVAHDTFVLNYSGARTPGPTFPASPADGQLFYETDTGVLWAYQSAWTRWSPVGGLPIYSLATGLGTGVYSSAAFGDVPGPADLAFVKRATHTYLVIWGTMTHYVTAAAGMTAHALRINGVDYSAGDFHFNLTSTHMLVGLGVKVASGLAAGSYTARLRWRHVTGGVTLNTDANDVANFFIQECL